MSVNSLELVFKGGTFAQTKQTSLQEEQSGVFSESVREFAVTDLE